MNILDVTREMLDHTPCFYYDTHALCENVMALRAKMNKSIKLCYSIKSNPFMAIYAAKYADYVEVCSDGEIRLCADEHIKDASVIVGGIYKDDKQIAYLANKSYAKISIESVSQLKSLSEKSLKSGIEQRVLLRLSSGNQFGMNAKDIISISQHQDKYPKIKFLGIHLYSGTQKKKKEWIANDLNNISETLRQCSFDNPEVEYGPGIGVPLFESGSSDWADILLDEMVDMVNRLSYDYPITLEFGRFLSANVGYYITKIVDIKENSGRKFYIVDGGINHLNYYGQLNGVPTPKVHYLFDRYPDTKEYDNVTICGSLCTANDILAKDIKFPAGNIGDYLVFEKAGAYSITEARTMFLLHAMPAVFIKDGGETVLIRETIDSYNHFLV